MVPLKRVVDLLMTVLLLLLMAFQVTGETAHEWLGVGMFVLVLIHQWLNRGMRWRGMGLNVLAVLAAGCGLHLFLVRDISSYLFLTTQFAFLDYDKAAVLVLAENLAMMSFWVLLAYQGYKALSGIVSRRWRSLLHPALMLTAAGGFSALLPLIFGGASGGTW